MDASPVLLLLAALAGAAAAVAITVVVSRRSSAPTEPVAPEGPAIDEVVADAVRDAVDALHARSASERDAAIAAAVQQAAMMQREQSDATATRLQAELGAKKDVIDARLEQVHGELRRELGRLGQMVDQVGKTSAERFGQMDESLRAHAEVSSHLAESTRSLREALANPQARGQWGERMAEDVLRLAGFVEHVNYRKQRQVDGGSGRPDYTFDLPKGHCLYMDVKFPLAAYLKYLEAGTEAEREAHLKAFLRDVRLRVKELAKREYAAEGDRPSVDYVLLFLPNEQLTGFIHEHDPQLLDDAMGQRVVLCSPLTLFAFLGVIRQAFDNFMIEQTSDEILRLLGKFSTQYDKYTAAVDKVKSRFDSVEKAFDELVGTRRRQLEKPLQQLEALRHERGLPVDGQLFSEVSAADPDADDDAPATGQGRLRSLGA